MLALVALLVVAFDVDAFKVAKLAVVPNRVVIVPETAVKIFENKLERIFRFVIEEVAARTWLAAKLLPVKLPTVVEPRVDEPEAKMLAEVRLEMFAFVADKFVEVELVIVPFVTFIAGRERLVSERLVMVADVNVAFPPAMLAVVMFAVEIFEVVEFVVEAFSV